MTRSKHKDHLKNRLTQTACDLYALGCMMLEDGVNPRSREFGDVSFALNIQLELKPWDELVMDIEAFGIDPVELCNERWRVPLQLHKQLEATR